MGKALSVETQLRTAKTDIRRLNIELARASQQATAYRERATKAEQAVAEWKERFDILLRRDGVPPSEALSNMEDLIERIENRVGMGHRAWDMVKPDELVRAVLIESRAAGVALPDGGQPWEVKVHCSKGERTLRAGMKWRDSITGSIWEVVDPEGGRIYSPSGLGGTPTFWCKPVEKTEAAQPWLADARADGCVSFCGDSIAAQLIDACGVEAVRHQSESPKPSDGGKG